jgi:F-type H+-transporting ATPase subunit b
MSRARRFGILTLLMVALAGLSAAAAQQSPPKEQKPEAAAAAPEKPAAAHEGEAAKAGEHKEAAEEEENAEFKESPSVQALARLVGLKPKSMYKVLLVINFLIIAGLIYWIAKARVPEMFRARTREIQKSLEEARRATEDANRRLAEIEERLAKLDTEIGGLRAAAEADARAEEERIRALAEADKKKIVEAAEQEIDAAAGQARRDLKAYTAELAVALAEKRIKVDPATDQALVRTFVGQLKEGK